jgi:alpha-glucosidase
MDFTPGGFRQVSPATFVARDSAPLVMGTRAGELALFVVYESALAVIADTPPEYRKGIGQGTEFLQQVPTAWDETRVIEGLPGEFVTIARRVGSVWYVGGLAGDAARQSRLALSFLGAGPYDAQLWSDAADADAHPERVEVSRRAVTRKDTLTIQLAPAGGFALILSPRVR